MLLTLSSWQHHRQTIGGGKLKLTWIIRFKWCILRENRFLSKCRNWFFSFTVTVLFLYWSFLAFRSLNQKFCVLPVSCVEWQIRHYLSVKCNMTGILVRGCVCSVAPGERSACQQWESVCSRGRRRVLLSFCFSPSFSKTLGRTITFFLIQDIMFRDKKNQKPLWSVGAESTRRLITRLKLHVLMPGCVNPFTGVNTWTRLGDTKTLWE